MSGKTALTILNDRELRMTRLFDAPPMLVFKAWTDPTHLTQWWSPNTFTNPACTIDLRPGGAWRITMRSPEGVDHPVEGVILEVRAPERLVVAINTDNHPKEWREIVNRARGVDPDGPSLSFVMTISFEETAGKTKVTIDQRFESKSDLEANIKLGAEVGWSQSFDKLDQFLTTP